MAFEITKEYFEALERAIEDQNSSFIKESMRDLYAADVSSILDEMDTDQAKYILEQLDEKVGAEVISDLDEDIRTIFLNNFSSEELVKYINHIDSDDAVDILNEQPLKKREEVIALLPDREKARHIIHLQNYDEDSAGGLMAKELIKVNVNWTVTQCIEEIRRQAQKVEKIYSVYVVDDEGTLLGRLPTKKIILSEDKVLVADIYKTGIISVESYQHAEEVADLMQKYDLVAIPVVNVNGKLLGRITIDDVVDVITEQADLERQIMSGISATDIEEDETVIALSKARLPWLIIGMVGGMLGASFIGLFEKDLLLIPAMAFFIPLITATGGNVGIQSSSLILQSLASKSIFNNQMQHLGKVVFVGIINGLVLASMVLGINVLLGHDLQLSIVVSLALFFVILLSSLMGTLTPLVLDKLGINPALASGPFITTTNDLLGLAVYFLTARILFILL